jgi:hypothetical protein
MAGCRTNLDLNLASRGHELLHFGESLFEGGLGNVSHEDIGALLGKKDGGFEADATT